MNQCDGCMTGSPLRDGLHIDTDGHAFMTCQVGRYGDSMDIVERLRGAKTTLGHSLCFGLVGEAADEIARLRAEVKSYQETLCREYDKREAGDNEIIRLRDENESLRGSLEEWRLDLNSLRDENAKLSALLLWALYHHQGGISEVGQPIRRALGIGQYDHLTPSQIEMAKSAAIAQEMTDAQG